ncbi:hypothetical protein LX95_02878 [Mesonia algae]|uniref:Uncharacterized protein n=1 Tax=Mesonia algae TaxID=213248 RepID=A0A2W7JRM2_9FLAO|nr:hypothetical protein [Mesonia algae]PZW37596.1 hypothetical protein LX95_02878 [Mesonia algae]
MENNFARWQLVRINQLTFINNLILGLSLGLLAYVFNFVQSDEIIFSCIQKILFWIGCITSLCSIALALLLALNRLKDFRKTANLVRKLEKKDLDEKNKSRQITDNLGKTTWKLFYWQIATFCISFVTFSIFILMDLYDKIT